MTAECLTIPLLGDLNCLEANLWYFATLAYPNRSERSERASFLNALLCWRIKPIYKRVDSKIRKTMRRSFPASDLQMKNEKIRGVNHKGLKRVENRILAGCWAWSLCSNDLPILDLNPTTATGVGVALVKGKTTVVEGIREYLRRKEEKTGVHTVDESAEKNAWQRIWSESMPVLHLAIPLYLLVQGFEENLGKRMAELLLNPTWVVRSLARAELLRTKLHKDISLFDPDKAARILPREYY